MAVVWSIAAKHSLTRGQQGMKSSIPKNIQLIGRVGEFRNIDREKSSRSIVSIVLTAIICKVQPF